MRWNRRASTQARDALLALFVVVGCRGTPSVPHGTGGSAAAGGRAAGGATGGSAVGAGGAAMGGLGAAGTGGERAWQAQPCEPGDVPTGVWTPTPWQPHEDDPTCQHVPVEAECKDGWCQVPAGCYVAGASPQDYGAPVNATKYTVRLTHSFEMQQAEFGREEWLALGLKEPDEINGDLPCRAPGCPVGRVTWFSALRAANSLSESRGRPTCYQLSGCTGQPGETDYACTRAVLTTETVHACEGYRLPTQAEWEYAYRAGTQTAYYSGSVKDNGPFPADTYCYEDPNLAKIAWYCFNTSNAQPSKCRQPNRWGLHDMAGNLPEWVSSSSRISSGPVTDPGATLESEDPTLVQILGGSVYLWPAACAASFASTTTPKAENGFRLVRTLSP